MGKLLSRVFLLTMGVASVLGAIITGVAFHEVAGHEAVHEVYFARAQQAREISELLVREDVLSAASMEGILAEVRRNGAVCADVVGADWLRRLLGAPAAALEALCAHEQDLARNAQASLIRYRLGSAPVEVSRDHAEALGESLASGAPLFHAYLARNLRLLIYAVPLLLTLGMAMAWLLTWLLLRRMARQQLQLSRSRDRLDLERRKLRMIFNRAPGGLLVVDGEGRILSANPAVESLFAYGEGELAGMSVDTLLPASLREGHRAHRERYQQAPKARAMGVGRDLLARRRDGSEIEVEVGLSPAEFAGEGLVLCSVVDVSERKRLERELSHQAYIDALTGLPNRAAAQRMLQRVIARAGERNSHCAVLFIDLDRFKDINDGWGHTVGDEVIRRAAERLSSTIRRGDFLARLGGDEFVAIACDLEDRHAAGAMARSLVAAFEQPITVVSHAFHVPASVGIGVYPDDGAGSAAELLQHADAALYKAKTEGRGRWAFFSTELTEQAAERAWIEGQLRQALAEGDQLGVALQPVVRLQDMAVVGYEALVRWQHPERGPISPGEFVPVAERSGLIEQLGAFVLRRACALGSQLHRGVAVNVSPWQLRRPHFPSEVAEVLRQTRLPAERLELEITEGAFVEEGDRVIQQLQTLRDLGVQVAIDDFGTGYSSLQYLKRLPVDRLKIDRAFVQGLPDDPDNRAIVETVLALAHRFGLGTTAEGIETPEQLRALRALGCEIGQGFLLGRPETDPARWERRERLPR